MPSTRKGTITYQKPSGRSRHVTKNKKKPSSRLFPRQRTTLNCPRVGHASPATRQARSTFRAPSQSVIHAGFKQSCRMNPVISGAKRTTPSPPPVLRARVPPFLASKGTLMERARHCRGIRIRTTRNCSSKPAHRLVADMLKTSSHREVLHKGVDTSKSQHGVFHKHLCCGRRGKDQSGTRPQCQCQDVLSGRHSRMILYRASKATIFSVQRYAEGLILIEA